MAQGEASAKLGPLERIQQANKPPAADVMKAEYETLRQEILQLYREQTQLAFASALPLAGGLFLKQYPPDQKLLVLAAGLVLLSGLAFKLRANYYRIFCIGTYLSIIHERKGKALEDFHPGPCHPGWHTRWRKIDTAPVLEDNASIQSMLARTSLQADATFLSAIAITFVLMTAGDQVLSSVHWAMEPDFVPRLGVWVNGLLEHRTALLWSAAFWCGAFGFLVSNITKLWHVQRDVQKFRSELELLIQQDRC